MSPSRSWIALALLAAFASPAAVIYKWTDDKGVVHYSDQPVPGAEKIVTSGRTTLGVTSGLPNAPDGQKKPPAQAAQAGSVSISSPSPEQTFFGDEPIIARATVLPELKAAQTLTWRLGGQELAEGTNAPQFTLPHLDRGTYSLTATVADGETGAAQTSAPVTFYVRQPSVLSPQHRRP